MISAKQLQALRALALDGDGRAQRALVRLAERDLDPFPELQEENEQGPAPELEAAPVYPARHGFWERQEGLAFGRSFQGTIPNLNNAVPILGLDAMGPPRVMTVSISRNDPPSDDESDVFCRCQFGAGGWSDVVELDWANGVQFSVLGTFLNVSAVAFAPNPDAFTPREVYLGAIVSAYPRPGAGTAPARSLFSTVAPAGTATFGLPKFSRDFSLVGIDTVTGGAIYDANTVVRILTQDPSLFAVVSGASLGPASVVPLPGQARTITINNTSANQRRYWLRMGLAL